MWLHAEAQSADLVNVKLPGRITMKELFLVLERLEDDLKDIALEHAKNDAPHEACGLVAVYKGKENIFLVKISEELGEQFVLDPDDWINAEDQGEIG